VKIFNFAVEKKDGNCFNWFKLMKELVFLTKFHPNLAKAKL